MASWETTQHTSRHDIEDKFKPTLVKRAKLRHGIQVGKDKWIVDGNPKLGDQYDTYYVTLFEDEGRAKYNCSCQGHQGGSYRKMCSHKLYVILARKGRVDMDIDLHEEEISSSTGALSSVPHVTYPLHEKPAYVEGSGATSEEAREALDYEYCSGLEIRPLPSWVEYIRETQHDAVAQILTMYEEGKKVVFLDAPTGAGKTLIGEMVRRKVSPQRSVYTCSTLTLQDQFLEDFPYADVIKGRSNYSTLDRPDNFLMINASQCTSGGTRGAPCGLCADTDMCPYSVAKRVALDSNLAVANIAYLLTMANYQKKFTNQPFIIIDEADVLEQQLLSFISLNITERKMKTWNMRPPDKKTVMESWVEWVRDEAFPKVSKRISHIWAKSNWRADPKLRNEWMELKSMQVKLKDLGGWDDHINGWGDDHGMEGWVYMDYERGNVTFKPITVSDYAPDLLWNHSSKWLLMSATIISAQQMADDLGLEDHEWGVVTVPSDFPIESRPIYVQPVANMTWKEKDVAWPQMKASIRKIADYHEGERILVHTVSYQLAGFLSQGIRPDRRFSYRNARERQAALERWLTSDDGVMFAPSFDRGVDLKDDLCRVVVVAKIPYPNLKDKQVNGRLYARGGQGWYSMLTIRSVVQMTGRAMRSKDDSCEIYMLDRQFVKNLMSNKTKKMLPAWWSEALVRSGVPKERGIK